MSIEIDLEHDQSGWDRIKDILTRAHRMHVKIGVLQGAGETEDGFDLVELAAVHEYGSMDGHIPERSFIRSTFRDNRHQLEQVTTDLTRKIVAGVKTPEHAMDELGLWGATMVKRQITEGHVTPPLADSTVKRKGSSKPLYDTGQLTRAITWEVEE